MITVKRRFYDKNWHWAPLDSHLQFKFKGSIPETISKEGVVYRQDENAEPTDNPIYFNSSARIIKSDDSYRWESRLGAWKEYDKEGYLLDFGNRKGTIGSLQYGGEPDGMPTSIVAGGQQISVIRNGGQITAIRAGNNEVLYSYTDNQLTSVTDVLGESTTYDYDSEHRLVKKSTSLGQVTEMTYNAKGKITAVTNSEGDSFSFEYEYDDSKEEYYTLTNSSSGRVKEVWADKDGKTKQVVINGRVVKKLGSNGRDLQMTNAQGMMTHRKYDEWGNVSEVVYPDNTTKSFEYDHRFNRPTQFTNRLGHKTQSQYDDSGNLSRRNQAVGSPVEKVTHFSYDSQHQLTALTRQGDANTEETTSRLTYDNLSNITSITDPLGHKMEFLQYDNLGNPQKIKDKRGFISEYDYDKKGRLLSQTNPLGQITSYQYDAADNLTQIRDAAENEWQFVYNSRNQLIKTVDPKGHESEIAYKNRLPTQITDEEGKSSFNASYDNEGHLLTSIDGANNETNFHYSLNNTSSLRRGSRAGNQESVTMSDLPLEIEYPTYRQRRYYDKLQRLIRSTDILDEDTNYSVDYQYDAAGNILSQTDKEGKKSSFEYDALQRLTKVTNAKGGVTRLEYDARDNIIAVHDPKSGITRYEYDKNDNRIKQILPEGQITLYEYDAAGNKSARLDTSGQKMAYQYDALSRLTQVDYYTADDHQIPVKTVLLTYDVVGNLVSYDDGTTSAIYTYDALGQKLTETVDYGSFTLSHSYEYYANGLKKSFTGPDGVKITYSYDENNRLSAIDIPNAGRVTYNTYHWNRPAKITLPGGSQIDLAYDPLMRLLSKAVKDPTQQFLMDYEYEHSPSNNITKKTTEQGEYAYQYDELSRLTQATNPLLEDEHYTYDLLANRLSASGVEGSYDANNALLSYGDAEFEYDAAGNLVKKTDGSQVTHYEYNVEGRLVRVTDSEGNLIAEYDYDPFGRRIWKEVEGVKTYFVYAAEGLIGEYDDNGVEIKGYGYRPNSMWTTNPLFQKTNGSYYWYQTDHLGTPQKLLDSQGNVVWEAVYEAFGKARVDVDLVENHLRFAGQYFDGETGLHYNWWRYYEATTGRYLRLDPISSVNLYVYVSGNPVSFVDPFGLEKRSWNDLDMTFNQAFWDQSYIRVATNCYAYALNIPGYHGNPGDQYYAPIFFPPTCKNLISGAKEDGLIEPENDIEGSCGGECSKAYHKIQIFLDPKWIRGDFHVYRQDEGGLWSHKAGKGGYIDNLDAKGKIIICPINQSRDNTQYGERNYPVYCGTLCAFD